MKSSLDLIITTLLYKFADFNLDENEEWTGHSLAVDKVWHLALGDLFLLLSLLMTNFEWKSDYSRYVLLPLQHLLLKHLLDLGHHLSRVVLVIIDYWAYFLDEKVMTQTLSPFEKEASCFQSTFLVSWWLPRKTKCFSCRKAIDELLRHFVKR